MTETTIISIDGVEPVTLEEAKRASNFMGDNDSDVLAELGDLITDAREIGESKTWMSFVDKTYETNLDGFPCGIIELPKPPLIEVLSIKYDTDEGEQTLSEDEYRVFGRMYPSIEPVNSWPSTKDKRHAVRIRFKAGFGDTVVDLGENTSNLPGILKRAIKMDIKTLYDNKDNFVISERSSASVVENPSGSDFIYAKYSVRTFA